jgi:hypothetical protein
MAGNKDRVPVTVEMPAELLTEIDALAERELMTRAGWLRREVLLAVRASRRETVAA